METLYVRLVAQCGLSPLFAARAIGRALSRVGIESPQKLTEADLQKALPEIRKTIAPFLEDRVDEVMRRLSRLTIS